MPYPGRNQAASSRAISVLDPNFVGEGPVGDVALPDATGKPAGAALVLGTAGVEESAEWADSVPTGTWPTNVLTKTSSYAMGVDDGTIKANAAGGAITITLPPADQAVAGWPYRVKRVNASGGSVTVAPAGGAKIDGLAGSVVLSAQWQGLAVYSDGTDWFTATSVGVKHPPVPAFTVEVASRSVAVLTNTSVDPDGDALTYDWNWGDGSAHATTATPSHLYSVDGTFTVTLTATDATGLTGTATRSVTVVSSERRPFASTSLWNRTLADIYGSVSNVPVLKNAGTSKYDRAMAEKPMRSVDAGGDSGPVYPYWFAGVRQFTMAVYIPTPSTPLKAIAFRGVRGETTDASTVRTTGGGVSPFTFPIDPSWKPAGPHFPTEPQSDSQFIPWDRDNVLGDALGASFLDTWQVTQQADTDADIVTPEPWLANGSGQLQCENMSRYRGENTSSGIPGSSPAAYVSRGAGVPYIAGLIRKWEVDQGHIDHALALAWATPSNEFVFPASKTDGNQSPSAQLPEGARIFLHPDFPIADVADPTARIVLQAAKDYGAICIDHAGRPKLYAEADVSAGWGTNGWAENILRYAPIPHWVAVHPQGTATYPTASDLRIGDVRVDDTVAADPITGSAPVETGSVSGNQITNLNTVTTASWTPAAGEPVIVVVDGRVGKDGRVDSVVGNGITFRRMERWQEPYVDTALGHIGLSQNLVKEVWIGRAGGSPTTGSITVTTAGSTWATTGVRALRYTTGSTIRKFWTNDFANVALGTTIAANSGIVGRLRDTSANSLMVGLICARNVTVGAGDTTLAYTDTYGAGGNVLRQAVVTKPGSGAGLNTMTPTVSGSTEWALTAYEIT
jgi:PKD repeat protein